jgi:hypothetical protein
MRWSRLYKCHCKSRYASVSSALCDQTGRRGPCAEVYTWSVHREGRDAVTRPAGTQDVTAEHSQLLQDSDHGQAGICLYRH